MLGGADPVRVDRLDVVRICLAAPAQQELLRCRLALRDDVVGRRLAALGDCRGARHDPHHLSRQSSEVVAGLLVVDVDELLKPPLAREVGNLGLQVGGSVARQPLRDVRLGVRHPRVDVVVDQQPPDVLVGVAADELLDVVAAVTERAALPIGCGDRRLDGDDTFEPWLEVVHRSEIYR